MRLYLDSELSRLIYCRGFEYNERLLTSRLLRPGDIYVDIGANIGLFTLLAADRVGTAGKVFAFEPVSRTYRRLVENIGLNGFRHVFPRRLAISDSSGELIITASGGGFDAWSSFGRPYMGEEETREAVPSTSWDDFAAEQDLIGKVTMMKLDVEGWESRVVLGARTTLSRDDAPTLYVEFTEQAAVNAGSSCRELHQILISCGYELFLPAPGAKSLELFPPRASYPNVNLLAVKRRDWVEARLREE
jgi:FkbM family methyltransferase